MGRRTGRKRGAPIGNTNRLIHGRYAGAQIARRKETMALVRQTHALLRRVAVETCQSLANRVSTAAMEDPEAKVDPETARKFFAGPCEFFWGASSEDNLPPLSLPEIAFVGRSNVGKSSLINALTGQRGLARVSKTPGRTREINFFRLGERLILTDLPGYGYAKASKALAAEWQRLIFAYLRGRATLRRVALLIDARRGVGDIDRDVMGLLDKAAVSYLIVLTKLDELKPAARAQIVESTGAEARSHVAAYPGIEATSAQKGEGLEGLRCHLAALAAP